MPLISVIVGSEGRFSSSSITMNTVPTLEESLGLVRNCSSEDLLSFMSRFSLESDLELKLFSCVTCSHFSGESVIVVRAAAGSSSKILRAVGKVFPEPVPAAIRQSEPW